MTPEKSPTPPRSKRIGQQRRSEPATLSKTTRIHEKTEEQQLRLVVGPVRENGLEIVETDEEQKSRQRFAQTEEDKEEQGQWQERGQVRRQERDTN